MLSWRVRAFTNAAGVGGNAVRVLMFNTTMPPDDERQRIATAMREPATAFVHPDLIGVDLNNQELPRRLIGHALLGTAAALASTGRQPSMLRLDAGDVPMWVDEEGMYWLSAPAAWAPNDRHRHVSTAAEVEAIDGPPADEPVQVWAWLDEPSGLVRARQFAPSEGKPEDEACGSACMVLAEHLARPLTVHHGQRSVIQVRPAGPNIALGGRCVIDEIPGPVTL